MNNYNIIDVIGSGWLGTIYKVIHKKNKKIYAMKISKIIKKPDEIEFSKNIKNMKHITNLVDYKIVKYTGKKYNPPGLLLNISDNDKKELQKYANSKLLIYMIYDYKDGVLLDIYEKMTSKQLKSMLSQIAYALYYMHKKGWYHLDLHYGNITYKKTSAKIVKLGTLNVKTYGYIWSLIDFDLVMKKNKNENNIKIIRERIGVLRLSTLLCLKSFKKINLDKVKNIEKVKNIISNIFGQKYEDDQYLFKIIIRSLYPSKVYKNKCKNILNIKQSKKILNLNDKEIYEYIVNTI